MKSTKKDEKLLKQLRNLLLMLQYKRPAGSKTEENFRKKFILPLGAVEDGIGNLILKVGDKPRVCWSCHTDTVHKKPGKQSVDFTKEFIFLNKRSQSNCLGADDTAGVWLMTEMVKAGVPGLYIFHYGEEKGGIGSTYLARYTPRVLEGIDIAIALDRRGINSVITHQFDRCCSPEFAKTLAAGLDMRYKADPTGVFTDTANYTELVSECTNLSVGFFNEHTNKEILHYPHLFELKDKLIALDQFKLMVVRDPTEKPKSRFARSFPGFGHEWDYDDYDDFNHMKPARPVVNPSRSLIEVVRSNPEAVADFLEECGLNADDISYDVFQRQGHINE